MAVNALVFITFLRLLTYAIMFALDNFKYTLYKLLYIITYACGVDFQSADYCVTWRTVLYMTVVTTFVILSLYTIVAKETETALKTMAIIATAFQVTAKSVRI